ncbi:MAG: hypothetical protein ACRD1G_03970, partial [Acidimicrobiales bacterium]
SILSQKGATMTVLDLGGGGDSGAEMVESAAGAVEAAAEAVEAAAEAAADVAEEASEVAATEGGSEGDVELHERVAVEEVILNAHIADYDVHHTRDDIRSMARSEVWVMAEELEQYARDAAAEVVAEATEPELVEADEITVVEPDVGAASEAHSPWWHRIY